MSIERPKFIAVGAYVIAEKIKTTEQTTASGIVLPGTIGQLARAKLINADLPMESVSDRVSEALRCLQGEEGRTLLYLEQHALVIDGDILAIPAEAIVALDRRDRAAS